MNSDRNLIFVKGEDKTEDIRSWKYEGGRIIITFSNGRSYPYASSNVEFFKDPIVLPAQDYVILKGNEAKRGAISILRFERHYKIIYKTGYKETFSISEIRLMKSCLTDPKSKNVFEYLKETAKVVSLKTEDGANILGNQYEKIDFVREDSILAYFLSGKSQTSHDKHVKTAIYPFGFNISQKAAVDNALNERLSIIEGPPGTGKTQTILNIIANIVMRGESVAVVSNNNSATKNVFEKLQKYDVDFIAAYLGSMKNKSAFIDSQTGNLPNTDSWRLKREKKEKLYTDLVSSGSKLDEMLCKKNRLSEIKRELDGTILESKHFEKYLDETYDLIYYKSINRLKSVYALTLWINFEKYMKHKQITFLDKIVNLFRYKLTDFSFYTLSFENMIALCQKQFYIAKIKELTLEKETLESELSSYAFDHKMKEYSDHSMELFKHSLSMKYQAKSRKIFEQDDLWKNSAKFIDEYPVVLSTTYSLRSSLSSRHVFDYVIIDEASQVNLATGALALSCAKRAVIVGDLKQLPNVVDKVDKVNTDIIFNTYDIPEAYRYAKHSMLSSVANLFENVPRTLLREHYRCHPKIIEFCNRKFYNNQLIILTEDKNKRPPLMVYKTVKGNHSRDHLNQREIDVIEKEIIPQQQLDTATEMLGIVTPYDAQRNALQALFKGTKVKADSVDKFQGQERPVIIISTVDNKISEFADDPNRLNVAVSRAEDQLILVTNGNEDKGCSNTKDLIDYIKYNNLEIIQSKTYSIFDNLFSGYFNQRRKLLAKSKRISEYDSENLMYKLICEVLSADSFSKYQVACHVPLKMLIRDATLLDDEETRYAMNVLTHVDFLIYDSLGKTPVMIIEVDGVSFHKEGSRQGERDKVKNRIFDKYELPYIRLRTDGSNEREQLVTKLNNIVKSL